MSFVQRAINILTQPKPTWDQIAVEPASVKSIFTGYVLILAAIPVLIGIVFSLLGGIPGLIIGLVGGAIGLAFELGTLFVMSLIVNALAPSFAGVSNPVQSLKLVGYARTPVWVFGIVGAVLMIIPILGWMLSILLWVAACLYAAYLVYLGAGPVLRVPQDKVAVFTLITVAIWIALNFVVWLITVAILGAVTLAVLGGAAMAAGAGMYR